VAKNASRPGRRLVIFGLLVVALYAGVALGGQWTPKLGLDLQGGTRITLEASTATGEDITPDKMAEARSIIDQRVNGQGVAEAEVAVQGDRNIVVEIPGQNAKNLVDAVKQEGRRRGALGVGVPQEPRPVGRSRRGGQEEGQEVRQALAVGRAVRPAQRADGADDLQQGCAGRPAVAVDGRPR
jgi:preprotein translocase subunit SecD